MQAVTEKKRFIFRCSYCGKAYASIMDNGYGSNDSDRVHIDGSVLAFDCPHCEQPRAVPLSKVKVERIFKYEDIKLKEGPKKGKA